MDKHFQYGGRWGTTLVIPKGEMQVYTCGFKKPPQLLYTTITIIVVT